MRTFRPASMCGHAASWAGVGAENSFANQSVTTDGFSGSGSTSVILQRSSEMAKSRTRARQKELHREHRGGNEATESLQGKGSARDA